MHLVNDCADKVVVGSGHGDTLKYVGKDVALYDMLVSLADQKW